MSQSMSFSEKKAAFSLAIIFACRMLGLFMILPVFSLYAHQLRYATPLLIGITLGVYGFTQAILQIPFGTLSDRLGRKPIIATGLAIFILGSVIAALSHTITGVMIGRALQGAGAIGSTTIALLADLTHEDNRSKAMAILGMVIGFSFMVAMIIGPIINTLMGTAAIFWFTALIALMGMIILSVIVPKPPRHLFHYDSQPVLKELPKLLKNKSLLCLDFSVFVQHALLTATFVVLPIVFHHNQLAESSQWKLYAPVLLIAFMLSIPCIIVGEKKRKIKTMFLFGIACILIGQIGFWLLQRSNLGLGIVLCVFFTGFSLLEALLPSWVSKLAPAGRKGTAMGIYSTAQFFGIFVGGLIAGLLYQHYHITDVFWFCIALSIAWLLIMRWMPKPANISSRTISITNFSLPYKRLQERITALPGVFEVLVAPEEQVAYLKIDKDTFNPASLDQLRQGQ